MGDIGKLDKNRNLYVTGRVKDIIILKNAKKINASQIESIVSQCFEVMGEVCVKAKPNDSNYDDIHAFIYTRLMFIQITCSILYGQYYMALFEKDHILLTHLIRMAT